MGKFNVWQPPRVDWNKASWGTMQAQCSELNADRYGQGLTDMQIMHFLPASPRDSSRKLPRDQPISSSTDSQHKARSAAILRAWHDMEWTDDFKQHVRSLIMELSLHSGGEYQVYILCHAERQNIPLNQEDLDSTRQVKAKFVPPEFMVLTVLFNNQTLESWYPKVEDHRYAKSASL